MSRLGLFVLALAIGMAALISSGFQMAPQEEAVVSLTFDDGLLSQYEAAGVIESYAFKGTFYVPSGLLSTSFEGRPTMTEAQMKDLNRRGHEIGGHTYTHASANRTSRQEFGDELAKDFNKTRSLGIEETSFAYPYGEVNHEDLVANYYKSARGVEYGINPLPVPESSKYRLKIVGVAESNFQEIEGRLDDLKRDGGWMVFMFHDVVPDGEELRKDLDLTESELHHVLAEIRNSGIKVKTVDEVMR